MFRTTALFVVAAAVGLSAQGGAPGQTAPARDTSVGQTQAAPAAGRISGHVVAADTGRPISRARVNLTSPQGGGKSTLTDNAGAYELTEIPEGRFTLQASKSGFLALQYGQRRPLQPGTPIQLAVGQALKSVDFRLPRGGAIAGRVLDENNDAMPGIQVQVLEYRYAQGAKTLVPAGNAQTDDRGEYRVWGLNPGDYYVSALAPRGGADFAGRGGPGPGGRGGGPGGAGSSGDSMNYAPTYFPGVTSVSEARVVNLGVSAEVTDISFAISLVHTARISGRVTNPDGTAASGMVTLVQDAPGRNGGPAARNYNGPIMADGQFSLASVAPGRYTLRARGGGGRGRGAPQMPPTFASAPLTVTGDDQTGLSITLQPAAGLSGTATFQNAQTSGQPNIGQFRVSAPPSNFDGSGNGQTNIDPKTGAFNIDGLAPGEHLLQTQSPRGWTLKSATANGRDIIDAPFDLSPGQKLTNVSLVFTDQTTEIDGTVADERGTPVTEYTVLAFPENQDFWRALSRRIMTARPDQNGKYQLRALPAGAYYLAIIDPAEQGEWFEPSFLQQQVTGARRVTLADGQILTQDFTVQR